MSIAPPASGDFPPVPAYRAKPLRIACVQYDAKLGKVAENAAKVESMTSGLTPGSVDLVVLPEMALSGYMFSTPASILPYLETPGKGPTSLLASALAARLRCYVIAGYPEALGSEAPGGSRNPNGSASASVSTSASAKPSSSTTASPPPALKQVQAEAEGVGYNSALIADPSGAVVGNYRKTFRFETDKNWARRGDGFAFFDLPEPLGRVAVGICMDINPEDFVAPWNAFELSTFCIRNGVDMLVVPMNWLDPGENDSDTPTDPNEPSTTNISYWAARLAPFYDPTPGYTGDDSDSDDYSDSDDDSGAAPRGAQPTAPAAPRPTTNGTTQPESTPSHAAPRNDSPTYDAAPDVPPYDAPPDAPPYNPDHTHTTQIVVPPTDPVPGKELVFVACNRVGTEEGTRFVGTSCVMTVRADPCRVEVVECCSRSEERVMVAEV